MIHEPRGGNYLLTLAADPTAPESIKILREQATTIATAVNSMVDYLEEPLKGAFMKIKTQINSVLEGLPPTDQAPAALNSADLLRSLLGTFTMAQSMLTSMTEFSKSVKAEAQLSRSSITTEVEKLVNTRVTAGELITKEALQGKIDAAVNAAKEQHKTATTLLNSRRTLLTTASLPVPADEQLLGDEQVFNTSQASAKTRAEALKVYKVEANQMISLCWDADQPTFDLALNLMKANAKPADEIPGGRKSPSGFIGSSTSKAPAGEARKKLGAF